CPPSGPEARGRKRCLPASRQAADWGPDRRQALARTGHRRQAGRGDRPGRATARDPVPIPVLHRGFRVSHWPDAPGRLRARSQGRLHLTAGFAFALEVYCGCMPQDHDGRPFDPDKHDERPPVLLGAELANAKAVEARHREATPAPSPLVGVRYDLAPGEGDLFRFVESSRDEVILRFIHYCRGLDPGERAQVRSSLRMDDFYTLLTFARRGALRALRANDSE